MTVEARLPAILPYDRAMDDGIPAERLGDGANGTERAKPPHWLDEPRNIALLVLAQGAVGVGLGLAIWSASGRAPAAFFAWRAGDLVVGAATAAILIGWMGTLVLTFPRFLAWAADQQRLYFAHGRRYRPAHIFTISLSAGIGEEALFRGGLQTLAADHMPGWAAILLVSLLFAALHIRSRGVFGFVLAYSLLFGAVYHATASLAGVMLAHAAFDVWALALVQRELVRQGMVKEHAPASAR